MPVHSRAVCLLATALALVMPAAGLGQDAKKAANVTLKVATYAEMGQVVKQLKGKVVVVDFWSDG